MFFSLPLLLFTNVLVLAQDIVFFKELVQMSDEFDTKYGKFPDKDTAGAMIQNRIKTVAEDDVKKQAEIASHAEGTRPIIHKRVHTLCDEFLAHKRIYGSKKEQELYRDMSKEDFINRLLTQRPLSFLSGQGRDDVYLLRGSKKALDGSKKGLPDQDGYGGFEDIGTDNEAEPLLIRDYLSYDEMQIAAFIAVAGGTYFINKGDRNNGAVKDKENKHIAQGIYIGLVGARCEKMHYMEAQHIISAPPAQGVRAVHQDLKRIWEEFYDEKFVTFEEAKQEAEQDKSRRYIFISKRTHYFNTQIYKKRLAYSIEMFLYEANSRGKTLNKNVYMHIVGIGLGAWQVTQAQAGLMLEVYKELLEKHTFSHISDINFSFFPTEYQSLGEYENGGIFTACSNAIKVHFSKRSPADLLPEKDSDKLLVAMYAWDSNAYPGNEYWLNMLTATGDPAAASCSTIAELHNPLINRYVSAKYLVIHGSQDQIKICTTSIANIAAKQKMTADPLDTQNTPPADATLPVSQLPLIPPTTNNTSEPLLPPTAAPTSIPNPTPLPLSPTTTLPTSPVPTSVPTIDPSKKQTSPRSFWGILNSMRMSFSNFMGNLFSRIGSIFGWGQ